VIRNNEKEPDFTPYPYYERCECCLTVRPVLELMHTKGWLVCAEGGCTEPTMKICPICHVVYIHVTEKHCESCKSKEEAR
jgi:hypothetical protein